MSKRRRSTSPDKPYLRGTEAGAGTPTKKMKGAYSLDLRMRVIEDVERGMSADEVAAKYSVSVRTVFSWKKRHRETGSVAKTRRTKPGPRRAFPLDKLPELETLLNEGATTYGWISDLWTIKRVAELVNVKFQVNLSRSTVWRLLKQDLGWSSIKPVSVFRERDEAKILSWRCEEFGQIKRRARRRGAYLAFADEAGFMLQPTLRKTFAPRGSRPVTRVSDPHGRISTACAITVSPNRGQLNLYFRLLSDNVNFAGKSIAQFLEYIRRQLRAPLTMIWDSIPIHHTEPVREYLRHQRDVVLEMIPEYAPELNPADGVWSYLKYGRLANYAPSDLKTLRTQVEQELGALKRRSDLLLSFIRKSQLSID